MSEELEKKMHFLPSFNYNYDDYITDLEKREEKDESSPPVGGEREISVFDRLIC